MAKYDARLNKLKKKLPRDYGGDFETYHLEKDSSILGPNDERLTLEELDALDANIIFVGWQKEWTEAESEANGLNGRLLILQDRLKDYQGKTDEVSLARAAKIESEAQDIKDELTRKGLPIEEERDDRPGAGGIAFKMKGRGWL